MTALIELEAYDPDSWNVFESPLAHSQMLTESNGHVSRGCLNHSWGLASLHFSHVPYKKKPNNIQLCDSTLRTMTEE